MKQTSISDFVNNQIEIALNIERVRLAEKFISEKQMNFEMQYAIDLLYQALCGFEKLVAPQQQNKEIESQDIELGDLSCLRLSDKFGPSISNFPDFLKLEVMRNC